MFCADDFGQCDVNSRVRCYWHGGEASLGAARNEPIRWKSLSILTCVG